VLKMMICVDCAPYIFFLHILLRLHRISIFLTALLNSACVLNFWQQFPEMTFIVFRTDKWSTVLQDGIIDT